MYYLLSNSALLQFIEVPFQIERVALLLDGCRFCATKDKLHLLKSYKQKLSKSILIVYSALLLTNSYYVSDFETLLNCDFYRILFHCYLQ